MALEERTYEAAVERLEAIIRRLDSNEAGLRETLELVKEGRELIEYAAGELDAVLDTVVPWLSEERRLELAAEALELYCWDRLGSDN